jgi:hypothetical protein
MEGAGTIMGTTLFINLFPEILRPYVSSSLSSDKYKDKTIDIMCYRFIGRLVSPSARRAREAAKFLQPIFEERMNMDPADRPVCRVPLPFFHHTVFSFGISISSLLIIYFYASVLRPICSLGCTIMLLKRSAISWPKPVEWSL